MSKTVFITGATGYIGGATLALLLTAPSTKSYTYAALVRTQDKASRLEAFGVRPVIATIDDLAIIEAEAEKADIVVHTASSSDHLPSSQAIIRGLKKRGGSPILIHVSGAGTVEDDARGEYGTDEVFSDLDPAHINNLPDDAWHRAVDLNVIGAAPDVRTHIILPPTIYGVADHSLVKAGVSHAVSIQVPWLIRAGIDRGQGATVGRGLNSWMNIHIDDIASVIVTVIESAVAGKTAIGSEGYYFGETGEHKLYDVYAEVARALSKRGIGSPEPTPFTKAEIQKYYVDGPNSMVTSKHTAPSPPYHMGSNSRCKAERVQQLGWTSKRTTADFIKSLDPEVEYILKTEGGKTST